MNEVSYYAASIVGVDERKEEKGGCRAREGKGRKKSRFGCECAITEDVGEKNPRNPMAVIGLNLHLVARKLPRRFT